MKRDTQDLRIASAVYAAGLCAVATAVLSLPLRKGQGTEVGGELPSLIGASVPDVLFGGSLAVPFCILALRDTRLGWTVPAVGILTIVAAFVAARMHPIYTIFMTLGVGYLAMGLVRCFAVRISGEAIQEDGTSRPGDGG